jgi:hypothetical protein
LNVTVFQRLIAETVAPEVLALAPTGFVAHAVDWRTRLMMDIAQVPGIKTVPAYVTAARSHCDMHHGPPVAFNRSASFEQAAIIAAKIIARLKEYQTEHGGTG